MPAVDPTKIFEVAQREVENAKSAREQFCTYLIEENERLRDDIKELSNVRVQNERLAVRAEMVVVGDALLTIGSIGFGFLGVYGGGLFSDSGLSLLCIGVAVIGLEIKIYQWRKQ